MIKINQSEFIEVIIVTGKQSSTSTYKAIGYSTAGNGLLELELDELDELTIDQLLKLGIDSDAATHPTATYVIPNYTYSIYRDLVDPRTKPTIRGLITKYNRKSTDFTPCLRNFRTKSIIETTYAYIPVIKDSIVFVDNQLMQAPSAFKSGCSDIPPVLARISSSLSKSEILPSRFTWP